MKVILTNQSTVPVPVSSTDGDGLAAELKYAEPYSIDDDKLTVVTVGDNPSFKEDAAEAFGKVFAFFTQLLTFWREHAPKVAAEGGAVRVRIDNRGATGLRVRQGDDVNLDFEVAPQTFGDAASPNYVELRELSTWNPVEGTP